MPRPSPFYPCSSSWSISQEWHNWSGYLAAGTYEPYHEREYYGIRTAAALIDVSPLFKYEISGPDALQHVDRIMTRDILACQVGQVMYSPWCDDDGKVIDDGTVQRLEEERFRITAADPSLDWFEDAGFEMNSRVEDLTDQLAALAIQGPNARAILEEAGGINLAGLGYYHLQEVRLGSIPLVLTRTGYTGDLGYELWVSPDHAMELWDRLMAVGSGYGLLPAGLAALDIARIEAGLVLIEVDYISSRKTLIPAQLSSPYEIGLGWTVDLESGRPFVGRRALADEHQNGSPWALVGLEISWTQLEQLFAAVDLPPQVTGRASRQAVPVYKQGRQIGQVTSSTFSPVLKKYIAIGTLESQFASLGTQVEVEVTVEYQRQQARAEVVRMPFYNPSHKKA